VLKTQICVTHPQCIKGLFNESFKLCTPELKPELLAPLFLSHHKDEYLVTASFNTLTLNAIHVAVTNSGLKAQSPFPRISGQLIADD